MRSIRGVLYLIASLSVLFAGCIEIPGPVGPGGQTPVAAVVVSPTTATLVVGSHRTVTATPVDAAGNPLADRPVEWSTSNAAVATVSSSGVVTGVAVGEAVVTATSEEKSGTSSITVTAPPPSTPLYPGDNLQAKINAQPAGTTFIVKAGVHRGQEIVPRTGDTFVGEPGAILSGAKLLTAFVREGGHWVATGQTQGGNTNTFASDICSSTPRCRAPEDLFIDGTPLLHVGSMAEVAPGKWYFDYVADKIYFADDPTGRMVETSVATFAFTGAANNVTIRGLVIEKYATPPQLPAIFPGVWQQPGGNDWVIEDNEVRWNHAVGLGLKVRSRLSRNFVHHNGEMGIGGTGGDFAIVEDNEIAFNNHNVWFNWLWEGGGTKFVMSNGLTVRRNYSHDNHGPGLWTDIDNINVLYEGNRVENNEGPGIFHEISCAAVIRNNIARSNRSWANVYISSSKNTEVHGNTIEGHGILLNMDHRGAPLSTCGELVVENVWVHDNTVTLTSPSMGLQQQVGDNGYFTSRNNRFEANHYDVADPVAGAYWKWMNGNRTWSQWQGYGQDVAGSVK